MGPLYLIATVSKSLLTRCRSPQSGSGECAFELVRHPCLYRTICHISPFYCWFSSFLAAFLCTLRSLLPAPHYHCQPYHRSRFLYNSPYYLVANLFLESLSYYRSKYSYSSISSYEEHEKRVFSAADANTSFFLNVSDYVLYTVSISISLTNIIT